MHLSRLLLRFFRPRVRAHFLCDATCREGGLIVVISLNSMIRDAILSNLRPVKGVTIHYRRGGFRVKYHLLSDRRRICPVSVKRGRVARGCVKVLRFRLLRNDPTVADLASIVSLRLRRPYRGNASLCLVVGS